MTDVAHAVAEGGEAGPVRTCFACRASGAKQAMLRLVVDGDGQVWPDLLQQAPGRGAYLCMRQECWARLSDKRFGALRAKFDVAPAQWQPFQARLRHALGERMHQMLTRLKATAAVGRDAAMQHLWKSAPITLLVAEDAGDALVRQLQDAVAKRRGAGVATRWCVAPSSGQMGSWLDRDKVSVLAIKASVQAEKLEQACAWFRQVNEAE